MSRRSDRTIVRHGEDYSIVRWEEMPPIAPHATFHLRVREPYHRSVHPTYAEADQTARELLQTCPLLTALPLYEEPTCA